MSINRPKRWPIRYPAQLISQDFYTEGITLNASPGGLAIESSRPLSPGTIIYVRLLVPERGTSIDFQVCRVNWCLQNRIGLEAIDMDPREEERLLNILMSRNVRHSIDDTAYPAIMEHTMVAGLRDILIIGMRLLTTRPVVAQHISALVRMGVRKRVAKSDPISATPISRFHRT